MDSLLPLRFIVFGLAFAGLVYLQFWFAHRQWRRLKGTQSADIDLEYVKMEDCLPRSFRAKANDWLKLPSLTGQDAPERIIMKGRERIRVTGELSLAENQGSSDVLIVGGDFSCGSGCRITSEVWAAGNATIGKGSQLQAIAADGALMLGEQVTIARWADSDEQTDVGAGCRIGARVTSRKSIRLGEEAQVLSAYAPVVSTADWNRRMKDPFPADGAELLEIGPPQGPELSVASLQAAGIEPAKLVQLSPQCWSYLGDFRPSAAIRLNAGLVVKGQCRLAGGSILSGDVKAHRGLCVGPSSVCDGNLVSGGDLCLGHGCRFSGVIHAEGSLLLSSGTRGVLRKDMVAVYASQDLCVERNVAINGKLASGSKVVVIEPLQAKLWRREHCGQEV